MLSSKPNRATLIMLSFLGILSCVQCDPKCLVDQSNTCANPTEYTCSECNSGYYLRNFLNVARERQYNYC